MLDEGVGGSLTTHLQEVYYQAARVNKVQPLKDTREVQLPGGRVSIPSKFVLATCWQLIYYPDVWNKPERFEIETPKTHLYHFTISLWSWTTENLDLLLFSYQKTLACYRNNHLPVREGDRDGSAVYEALPNNTAPGIKSQTKRVFMKKIRKVQTFFFIFGKWMSAFYLMDNLYIKY